jgi:hypothetical protein
MKPVCLFCIAVMLIASGCASQSAKKEKAPKPGVLTIIGLPESRNDQKAEPFKWVSGNVTVWGTASKPTGTIEKAGDGLWEAKIKEGTVKFLLYTWNPGEGFLAKGKGYEPYIGNDAFENVEVSLKGTLIPFKLAGKIPIEWVNFVDGSAELEWYYDEDE